MPRSIWTGSLSFGLVNVPVKLLPAVREHDVRFHQLDAEGNRVRYKRVSEKTGDEVPYDEIVKGYEISKGRFVRIQRDDLEKLAPRATHTIDVEDFVDLDAIDPVYFERTYYLAPEERAGAAKAYALLLRAMEESGKVAIARIVMRDKQHLAAVRPLDGVLALSTMLFSDEVLDRDVVDLDQESVSKKELELAQQIIDSLATEWQPTRYQDTYREQLEALIEAKARGEEIVEPERTTPAPVGDLMAALRASLEQSRSRDGERDGEAAADDAQSDEAAAGEDGDAAAPARRTRHRAQPRSGRHASGGRRKAS